MQHVATYSYQYTEYKHLAKPNIDITQFTLKSVATIIKSNKVIC